MAKDICIYGGTFDPVHLGHLIVARAAAEELGISRITLIPAMTPPHKETVRASFEQRVAMLKLATADDSLFEVSDIEAGRSGPSYTFDTVAILRKIHGDDTRVRIIIGMDMLADLPDWHRAGELVKLVDFVIVARNLDHYPLDQMQIKLSRVFGMSTAEQLLGSVVSAPQIDISSTEIRSRARQGKSLRYLVPDEVAKYIFDNTLYI